MACSETDFAATSIKFWSPDRVGYPQVDTAQFTQVKVSIYGRRSGGKCVTSVALFIRKLRTVAHSSGERYPPVEFG